MKIKISVRISAVVLAVVILFTSAPIIVNASNDTDTESTNIIKLLDMVLNKCGVSASPTTIQDIYDYMQDTVVDGAQAFSDLVDSAYSNVSDYVSACKNKISDATSSVPDSAKSLINGYIDYMGRCTDTVANFKAGYAQGANFRNYILSYVTDQNGKQLSSPIKKGSKYNIKGGLVNLVKENLDAYIKEYEGYYLIPTNKPNDLLVSWYSSKSLYDNALGHLTEACEKDGVVYLYQFKCVVPASSFIPVCNTFSDNNLDFSVFNSDWVKQNYFLDIYSSKEISPNSGLNYQSNIESADWGMTYLNSGRFGRTGYQLTIGSIVDRTNAHLQPFSIDGHPVKVWKSIEQFKLYSVGQSNIYYSSGYGSFDTAGNNGISFDGQYYINQDYSHTTIQNNIDNSSEVNETIVNNIVNNYITNNYYGDSSGDVGGGDSGGGNWFLELIKGIPELLSALVDGIANIADSIGNLFESLFARFFIPSEEAKTELKEAAETKFNFVTTSHADIVNISERLETMGSNAPTINLPLSKTPLVKYGVGDVTVSFDWFEPYRYGFHTLLSSIMWIMFLFNQYFGLKNLIQGTGSFAGSLSEPEPEHNRAGFDLW